MNSPVKFLVVLLVCLQVLEARKTGFRRSQPLAPNAYDAPGEYLAADTADEGTTDGSDTTEDVTGDPGTDHTDDSSNGTDSSTDEPESSTNEPGASTNEPESSTNASTSTTTEKSDDGLSGGAIAGIVIGTTAGVILIAGGGWYIFAKKTGRPLNPC